MSLSLALVPGVCCNKCDRLPVKKTSLQPHRWFIVFRILDLSTLHVDAHRRSQGELRLWLLSSPAQFTVFCQCRLCMSGRGLFMRGHAPVGTVVALVPGLTYTRTQLPRMPGFPHVSDCFGELLDCKA
jgi:hypothetical protein